MDQWQSEEVIKEKIYDFYFEKLKFCGCANPEFTLIFIKKLLNLIDNRTKSYNNIDYNEKHNEYHLEYQKNLIMVFEFKDKSIDKSGLTDIQNGILQFVLYFLDEVGVLEHAGNIKGVWLSMYGREMLECLNKLSDEDIIGAIS